MRLPSPKEFYEKYESDPESGRKEAYKKGRELGWDLLKNLTNPKKDLDTIVRLLNEFQKSVQGSPTAKVVGGKIVMECSGFCPIMRAAITMNLPWLWLDENLAWPLLEGLVSAQMPQLKLDIVEMKSKGDNSCIYVFE